MKLINLTPRFWVAASLVAFTLVIGLIGPLVIHVDPHATIGGLYDKPSFKSIATWLGTDNAGQSVIANLVHGVRTSLFVGVMAGAISTLIGLVLGLVAGFQGGLVDDILMGATNIALAIPSIVVVILLSIAVNGSTSFTLAMVIGVTGWPWTARAVRAQATSVRNREHIDVARLSGARWVSILGWDVLPYLLSYVVMAFVLQMSGAILAEAALSMLGLGPSGSVSLGIMLYWALAWGSVRTGAWWAFMPPTLMLTLIAFSLLLLQASLDEVFNPRLRRGRSKRRLAIAGTPAALPTTTLTAEPVLEGDRP
ncbi:MAG: ABC transporter permease [Microlunatus sp.]|nr:ABC transporter permease [Microlunatus sp.]